MFSSCSTRPFAPSNNWYLQDHLHPQPSPSGPVTSHQRTIIDSPADECMSMVTVSRERMWVYVSDATAWSGVWGECMCRCALQRRRVAGDYEQLHASLSQRLERLLHAEHHLPALHHQLELRVYVLHGLLLLTAHTTHHTPHNTPHTYSTSK